MDIQKDSLIYQYIAGLCTVLEKSAAFLDGIDTNDCSPEEKAIAEAISAPIMTATNPRQFLEALEKMLKLWAPGTDIAATGVGFIIKNEANDKGVGIRLQFTPDKAIIAFMDRQLGELVEKNLRESLDKTFGRIITKL